MGKHEVLLSAEKFAEEMLGTHDEQIIRWIDDQMRWRQTLVDRYRMEIDVMQQRKAVLQKQIAERAADRARAHAEGDTALGDPEQTQEFEVPAGPESEEREG